MSRMKQLNRLNRRQWLEASAMGILGASACSWLPALADELAPHPKRRRHCILLWMAGGPTQTDTFDMKPQHANGGEFKEIATSAPGLRFSEHLPNLAKQADKLAVIRSLSTKEGDHGRGTYLMRTGHQPMGQVRYPTIGASLSKELVAAAKSPQKSLEQSPEKNSRAPFEGAIDIDETPGYVSIAPYRAFNQAAYSPGFLGPRYAPLTVGATDALQQDDQSSQAYAQLKVDDLLPPVGVDSSQAQQRIRLWRSLQDGFLATHRSEAPLAHDTVYRRAVKLMNSDVARAFDLSDEPEKVRAAYGKGRFGQGCLMARRLIERGVAFVEVSLGAFSGNAVGWDTHTNNFTAVKQLSAELDAGWGTLMAELSDRGLLETTTIIWMGEFGRTPQINDNAGRDHFPAAWSCVLAGGGIRGGQAYGKTSDDGMEVVEGKVDVGDILATLCQALGVSPDLQNISEMGRPIRIAEGTPIQDILA